ncbi:periplasmic binding protein-like II [Anaeromyces robustus]|uniref:Periplasmic binding protein-like II n=1 Tax=Anaeromyces robustus TaxID=1754192 RepID=A0A1Y1WZM5_9FUNG|nr:periplasmic binding protein-like II [Anaeromyces robustus]|eukprot:ORX79047.1 periplasmic binding protein-like II [Anaeromyces robustus]
MILRITSLCLLIQLFYINIVYGEKISLNIIAYSMDAENQGYTSMVSDFNQYAEDNNLNITLNINLLTNANTTVDTGDYATLINSLLMKNSYKYDLYIYDNGQTQTYGKYLLDLSEYLPEDYLESFDPNLISSTCIYDNKQVGFPFSIGYSVLYSNKNLLEKHHKPVPKTWDELIETSKYILERENNPDLIAYNGYLDKTDEGVNSVYEFLYSSRETIDSPFPEIKSKTSADALNLIKRLKDEIASGIYDNYKYL